jgi:hypothetical protein
MILFGLGHSLLVTMQAPIVQQMFSSKSSDNKKSKSGVQ